MAGPRAERERPGVITPRLIVDDVYAQLMALIMDGHVGPGMPLSIDALAREFGVSSSPVREALTRLEATGLVQRIALRGYRVAPELGVDELAELMTARLILEPPAAAAASTEPSPEFLAALRRSVEALSDAPRGPEFGAYREYFEADRAFHRLIFENSNNRFLDLAYGALGGQVQRFRLFSGRGVTDAEPTILEHSRILEAIAARDSAAASAAMHDHVAGVRERALRDLENRDDVPAS
jgi:DNA-binding GntR family transcriptional regulator